MNIGKIFSGGGYCLCIVLRGRIKSHTNIDRWPRRGGAVNNLESYFWQTDIVENKKREKKGGGSIAFKLDIVSFFFFGWHSWNHGCESCALYLLRSTYLFERDENSNFITRQLDRLGMSSYAIRNEKYVILMLFEATSSYTSLICDEYRFTRWLAKVFKHLYKWIYCALYGKFQKFFLNNLLYV